jgi:hypothetical protein
MMDFRDYMLSLPDMHTGIEWELMEATWNAALDEAKKACSGAEKVGECVYYIEKLKND